MKGSKTQIATNTYSYYQAGNGWETFLAICKRSAGISLLVLMVSNSRTRTGSQFLCNESKEFAL